MIMFPTFRGGLASSTPPVVLPPELPANPDWYLEADQITGLSDNDLVATWPDISANGWHATQATSGSRPTYKTGIVNGLPVVRFADAKAVFMPAGGLGLLRNVAGGTLVAVLKHSSVPTSTKRVIQVANNTFSSVRAMLEAGRTSSKWGAGGIRLDSQTFQAIASSGNVDTSWHIHIVRLSYSTAAIAQWVDGVKDGESLTFQNAGNTSDTNSFAIGVGVDSAGNGFVGDLAVALAYRRAFSEEEVADATAYFAGKYTITLP